MCTAEQERAAGEPAGNPRNSQDGGKTRPEPPGVRVELIDPWHRDWDKVLARVDGLGQRKRIGVDNDGWLPARQNLLAAFVDGHPAGHLCFRVEPVCRDGHVVVDHGRPVVAAQVEALDVYPGFNDRDVRQLLEDAALRRAHDLRCRELRGLDGHV